MDRLYVVKIGGNIIDDEMSLSFFLQRFSEIDTHKILVHGGGKEATRLGEQLHIPQRMLNGRRITDAETLKVVTMVYAGYINKNIVAQLQAGGCNAVGVTGADGNCIQAHKRVTNEVDYGFAGDVDVVNDSFFKSLLYQGFTPVVAPITHDKMGQLLNTNADTIAGEIAKALSPYYETHLIYSFEKEGVLLDVTDDESVLNKLTKTAYEKLKASGKIFAGMIPKLDNAFAALETGVERIVIGNGAKITQLISGSAGTNITNE